MYVPPYPHQTNAQPCSCAVCTCMFPHTHIRPTPSRVVVLFVCPPPLTLFFLLVVTVHQRGVHTGGVGLTPARPVHAGHVQPVTMNTDLVHGAVSRVRTERAVCAGWGKKGVYLAERTRVWLTIDLWISGLKRVYPYPNSFYDRWSTVLQLLLA